MGSNYFRDFHDIWALPDSYVTLDVETSGLSPTKNLLCTFGWSVVQDRQLVSSNGIVLNWFANEKVNAAGFSDELVKVGEALTSRGKNFFHTEEYLKTRGIDPLVGLQQILDICRGAEAGNVPLVSFNGYKFDAEFLQAHFEDFLGVQWLISDNGMYDVGMVEKAAQLPESDFPLPQSDESMRSWAFRIGNMRRKGVFWALDTYVEPRYQITKRFNLDPRDFHKSDFDSQYLHYLVEAQRALALAQ